MKCKIVSRTIRLINKNPYPNFSIFLVVTVFPQAPPAHIKFETLRCLTLNS